MSDKVESSAGAVASAKKAAAPKMKKPKTKPSHPPTADMVNAAIKELKERNGSSLQAIKKYVAATYKVDTDKLAPFIKKYLKSAVASGKLVQPKGKGASGSFKLAVKDVKPKSAKSAASKVAKKPAATKGAKKPASPKKAAPKAKKAVTEKKKTTAKVAAKPPKAKSTAAKPKVTKAAPKKAAKAASPTKKAGTAAPKAKKPAAKKVSKK